MPGLLRTCFEAIHEPPQRGALQSCRRYAERRADGILDLTFFVMFFDLLTFH